MFCTDKQKWIKWHNLSCCGIFRSMERRDKKDVKRGELKIQREGNLTIFPRNPEGWFKPMDEQVAQGWVRYRQLPRISLEESRLSSGATLDSWWAPTGVVLSIFRKAWSSVWWLVPFNLLLFNKDSYDSPCHVVVLHQICLKMLSPKYILSPTYNC